MRHGSLVKDPGQGEGVNFGWISGPRVSRVGKGQNSHQDGRRRGIVPLPCVDPTSFVYGSGVRSLTNGGSSTTSSKSSVVITIFSTY